MKSLKVFLLGTAAFLFAGAAYGADMAALRGPINLAPPPPAGPPPPPPPSPAEKCKEHGAGFAEIPGMNTCMKVNGFIRFNMVEHSRNVTPEFVAPGDSGAVTAHSQTFNQFDMFTLGRISADAITKTDYGKLRSFVEIQALPDKASLRYGYLEFNPEFGGKITAGKTPSFFGTIGGYPAMYGAVGDFGIASTFLLGYTRKIWDSVSASISIEKHPVDGGKPDNILSLGDPKKDPAAVNDSNVVPDLVGNIIGEYDWGALAVSGALSETRVITPTDFKDSMLGWAVGLGGKVKLDSLAKGDGVEAQVSYSNGAAGYISAVGSDTALFDSVGPDLGLFPSTGYAVQGSFQHYWMKELSSTAYAGYSNMSRNTSVFADPTIIALQNDKITSAWDVGANLMWKPIPKLTIGTEIFYVNDTFVVDAVSGTTEQRNAFGSIFRVERAF